MAQIYGYTPIQKANERYVPFIALHADADNDVTFTVRNTEGAINEIMVDSFHIRELIDALRKHVGV